MTLIAFWNIEEGLYAVEDEYTGQVVADGFASMEEAKQAARDYWKVQWRRLARARSKAGQNCIRKAGNFPN
jgi:hypothetical protein